VGDEVGGIVCDGIDVCCCDDEVELGCGGGGE